MIKFENLTFSYRNTDQPVLRRINLEIQRGQIYLVSGATGSGKSTFLKTFNGLAPHFTGGTISGRLLLNDRDVLGLLPHELAELVGYVNQKPEGAFATDTVEEELVFSLEQLGWDQPAMHRRLQELETVFELKEIIQKPLSDLSGGQQQRVAIASALAAGQKLLVLDEPTSALDGLATSNLLKLLFDLAKGHGITIVIAEHRLERVMSIADSVLLVHGDGTIEKQAPNIKSAGWEKVGTALPSSQTVFAAQRLSKTFDRQIALQPIDVTLTAGSVTAVTGDNGAGKTSLLWEVYRSSKQQGVAVTMVPQNAADLLFLSTLTEELAEADAANPDCERRTSTRLEHFVGRINPSIHPRDLSAGQQLALVLAIQLGSDASLVILDEPTRGLDFRAKQALATNLSELRDQGKAILIASHDTEFLNAIATTQLHFDHGRLASDFCEN